MRTRVSVLSLYSQNFVIFVCVPVSLLPFIGVSHAYQSTYFSPSCIGYNFFVIKKEIRTKSKENIKEET